MEYLAKHHVRLSSGVMLTPGEIFHAELTPEKEAWLMSAGAIEKMEETDEAASAELTGEGETERTEAEEPATENMPETEDFDGIPDTDDEDGIIQPQKEAAKKSGGRRKSK